MSKHNDRIMAWLTDHGTLTRYEAFAELGETDLPKRISELRRQGVSINAERIAVRNRYGETTHVMRYSL